MRADDEEEEEEEGDDDEDGGGTSLLPIFGAFCCFAEFVCKWFFKFDIS